MRVSFSVIVYLVLGALTSLQAAPGALETVTAKELAAHVEVLASDEYEGRGAGTPGGMRAARYLAAEFERLGLRGGGDQGTYFQTFSRGGRDMRNVVAVLPGAEGQDECVVVGAHYDHLGRGAYGSLGGGRARGAIHNGADDNASGTAGILEMAEAFVEAGLKPRRSIVFVLFDGEELGLFGSKHFAKAPLMPLAKTAAMLNMDMIGRLGKKKLIVYGKITGSTFGEVMGRVSGGLGMELDHRDSMTPNSDHASFYEKQIPSIALFTGLHSDYHRPGDDVGKVDYVGMELITRLATGVVEALAVDPRRPSFAKAKGGGQMDMMLEQLRMMLGDEFDLDSLREQGPQALRRMLRRLRGGGQGQAQRPRFGVRGEPNDDGADGVLISEVTRDSVAARSGLRSGDRIVSFDGRAITSFGDLREAVGAARGAVDFVVLRGGQRESLRADFGGAGARKPKAKLY